MSISKTDSFDFADPRVDVWIFIFMLVLALIGAGISQALDSGGSRYWLALVVIYAAISITRAWLSAKRKVEPVWPMIRAEVLHWAGALVAINIVLFFESSGITDRGPAAVFSLLVLALSCYLAGVHFDWSFMLLGGILAIIAVLLGYADQLSFFFVAIPVIVATLAIWIVYKRKLGSAG